MNILAVDTATAGCGVAVLLSDGRQSQAMVFSGQTHASHLLPLIDKTLSSCGARLRDMDGFAVTRGPGSFTGLRIGISTVKGLAAAWDKPLAGVSSLEALAFPFTGGLLPVCALIDARKGQVYSGRYASDQDGFIRLNEEKALSPEEAAAVDQPCLFVGSGATAYRETITSVAGNQAKFAPPTQNSIRPEVVAFLGRQRLLAGQADDPAAFAPLYVRAPDATINNPE